MTIFAHTNHHLTVLSDKVVTCGTCMEHLSPEQIEAGGPALAQRIAAKNAVAESPTVFESNTGLDASLTPQGEA